MKGRSIKNGDDLEHGAFLPILFTSMKGRSIKNGDLLFQSDVVLREWYLNERPLN